ncbi:MAG: photosynthetic complex assembly protein PuhC [Geminicoccaceae bacterium]|nr:photosynthetic complex assembly protein PuhC [Geminicoccaceae bacterium]
MSRAAVRDNSVPRRPLIAAGLLVGFSLVVATTAKLTGIGRVSLPEAEVVAIRELRFLDRPDGSVMVVDPAEDAVVDVLPAGTNGFLRGVLRGLARDRKLAGLDDGPPFRLIRWTDGRLSLDDPATGRRVDLGAFGQGNAQAFARLVTIGRSQP